MSLLVCTRLPVTVLSGNCIKKDSGCSADLLCKRRQIASLHQMPGSQLVAANRHYIAQQGCQLWVGTLWPCELDMASMQACSRCLHATSITSQADTASLCCRCHRDVDPVVCRMQHQVGAFDYARQAAELPFPGGVRLIPALPAPDTQCLRGLIWTGKGARAALVTWRQVNQRHLSHGLIPLACKWEYGTLLPYFACLSQESARWQYEQTLMCYQSCIFRRTPYLQTPRCTSGRRRSSWPSQPGM